MAGRHGSQREHETPQFTQNITYMSNCTGVTIGGSTSQVYNTAICKPGDEQRTKKSKNLAGIHIVKEILTASDHFPSLHDLDEKAGVRSKELGFGSFTELSGLPVGEFLCLNTNDFDTVKKKGRRYVKIHRKSKPKKQRQIRDESSHQLDEREPSIKDKNDKKEMLQWQEVKKSRPSKQSHFGTSGCLHERVKTSLENEPSKSDLTAPETNANKHPYTKVKSDLEDRISHDHNESDYLTSEAFLCLVGNEGKDQVHLVESLNVYKSNPLLFSLDIVSLWNTPHRTSLHIVIGAKSKKELFGVEYVDQQFFQDLFLTSYFTMRPSFKCHWVRHDHMLFYVIEVLSSCGHGNPSFVKKTITQGGVSISENELWMRKGSENTVCKPTDLLYGSISHWFVGNSLVLDRQDKGVPVAVELISQGTQSPSSSVDSSTQNNIDSENEETLTEVSNTFQFFWDIVGGFRKGHFILIAGDVCCSSKHIDAFGLLPWLCVYDFDINSGVYGLLNAVQDTLETRRHLKTYCWNDTPDNISERGTRWCFVRGRREISSSRTDNKDETIEDMNFWFKKVKSAFDANCERLKNFVQDYTVLRIVMLWPKNEKLVPFMTKFMTYLVDNFSTTPNIVLCMDTQNATTDTGSRRLETLREDFSRALRITHVKFETICKGISNTDIDKSDGCKFYTLPQKEDKDETLPELKISEKDATWLSEDLEVLYTNGLFSSPKPSKEDADREISNFYRGGTLPWVVWYSEQTQGAVVERSIQKELQSKLLRQLDEYKTTTMKLFHAPGSGGTTLAQNVLWKLHTQYPCIHLRLRATLQIDELDRKTMFLYDKTGLPVLLLVDGEEESKVTILSRRLKYVVILYVKRYPYKCGSKEFDNVFLSGYVTPDESKELCSKLGERCEEDKTKKRRLELMTKEVLEGKNHCMYEYGMTVYLHEFKGIVSYVEGYLELGKNLTRDLTNCQRCLGYMALVYYYGQTCVPCQFFAALFHKPANFAMSLEDFPSPIEEFIVRDGNDGRRNNIRICHYIIAKEILEQILSRHTMPCPDRTDKLGSSACWNLSEFCMQFIEYASNKRTKGTRSSTVMFVLTKTFIFRDERDMGDNEEQVRKRPVLSKLMIDIPAGKPLFTERLKVLKKLVDSFPDDPNFRAHLGRFHAFCRPDEEREAESCFQKAVKLCDDQVRGKEMENVDDGLKLTMTHIYHMYGIVKQRYVAKFTGRSQKEKVVAFSQPDIFSEQIEEIVDVAQEACEYFTKSRDITPENHHVYTYAYTGEIQVRLQVCEFVNRHFKSNNDNNAITGFLQSECSKNAKMFVKGCITVIESLILECYMDVDLLKDDQESLRRLVSWYNSIFKIQVIPFDESLPVDTVSNRRLKIEARKLESGSHNCLNGIETIENPEVINEIVKLYEENFADIQKYGFQGGDGKRDLEREYRDWIYAIRHEHFGQDYELEDVLSKISFWRDKVGSPASVFYMFVVYSLLGFGTDTIPGKTECLLEALILKDQVMKLNHLVIRPKYPREWVGNSGNGIKRLKVGKRRVGLCSEDRDSQSSGRTDLELCKGIICRPNTHSINGMISLYLGRNTQDVRVYFIPKVAKLSGGRFAGQKVEFNLAFTIQHGYEAYNVKIMKRYACPSCSRRLEFTSEERLRLCQCGNEVERDELNEVND